MTEARVPPPELIVENGIGVADFERIAQEFIQIGNGITGNMIRMGLIKPHYSVLDVGCGLGRLARPLTDFLIGEYNGIDIVKTSVEWCREAYGDLPNFHFHHADIFSNTYNTKADTQAEQFVFPIADETIDFVWSTSLFTHMLIHQVDNYIGQMARVMRPGAHCWNTYLILDQVALELIDKLDGSKRWYMPHSIEGGRVRDVNNPESQIALYEDQVREIHAKHGLEITDVRYGPWSGRTDDVRAGGQDVIIARKL